MTLDDELEQSLAELRDALTLQQSIVGDVMSRTAGRRVVPVHSPSFVRWWAARLRPPRFAITASVASIGLFTVCWLLFEQPSTAAFAEQALAALERAKADGVTVQERTDVVMRDGSRHTSTTSYVFYVGRDSYRRDIHDGDKLREIQWYTPKGEGMLQTSVQYDTNTYARQNHAGRYGDEQPISRLSLITRFIGDADRRLDPMMIKGRQCPGFEIHANKYGDNPSDWVDRIWFDPETKLPARIELERPRTEKEFKAFITVQERFDWHPDLAADVFVPKIPDGFTRREEKSDTINRRPARQ
jgi:hypothetical protein